MLVDKPAGWTSFDVVNKIRYQIARQQDVRPKSLKVGHAGTLDPFATGLLVVLVGKEYTKQAAQYSKKDKTYEIVMVLGKSSNTGDPEGHITHTSDRIPTESEIKKAISKFKGEIMQTPHPFSAVKVGGQRAYKLSRQGKTPELEPRKVTIHKIKLKDYNYPEIKLVVEVSSGTYIRSLVEDIGADLGTGAYTLMLRRTKVGDFDVSSAKIVE